MTLKEVYDIVKGINEKLEELVNVKGCDRKHDIVWKVMFALFGFNMVGLVSLIIILIMTLKKIP